MPAKIEITIRTIILTAAVLIGGWLVIKLQDILVLLFMAFIVMSALKANVDYLVKKNVNRTLAIIFNYVVFLCLIALFATIVLPPLVSETIRLTTHFPQYINKLVPYVNINQDTIIQQIAPISQNVARFTVSIFSNVFTLLTILVFSFYFLMEHSNLRSFLVSLTGENIADKSLRTLRKIEERMGTWVRGEMILGLIIGISSYVGLSLLNVNFALPLALIAGVLELIPIIGPIISAVPAVIIAFTDSPNKALLVVVLYIIIQQVENNFIVPSVMKKTVGLPSIVILLALLIGGKLGGTIGIILAVPILLTVQTLFEEFVVKQINKI